MKADPRLWAVKTRLRAYWPHRHSYWPGQHIRCLILELRDLRTPKGI